MPLIIAFGHLARSGKGECVQHLAKKLKGQNVLVTSFGKALRSEIHKEMHKVAADEGISSRAALEVLCERHGVPFDPHAGSDKMYPHGKQRRLLQHWGTEYRRAQDPHYWVNKVAAEIAEKKPSIILIDDLRFKSEVAWVLSQDGITVNVVRPGLAGLTGTAATHISEHELSSHAWAHTIVNDGSLKDLHERASKLISTLL